MTLIVETGTGLTNAESYASVAQADARLASLGNTLWATLSESEKEQALRRATVYMEGSLRQRWKGTRTLRAQALSWPRYGVSVEGYEVSSTLVPQEVVAACIDLAFKAAGGDLAPDTQRLAIREKVGPLETEYSPTASQLAGYVAVERTLAPFVRAGATGGVVVGLIRS